ncbi:PhzF family phenazine biosynthesis protein [Microvirga sp. BSC39]|uniref:PhzF family phenazine biosynthesis protein n=1 Tax=Microvirga sp. BSC39 TaxID=1549810 RepID=UPI0004E9685F|nr:PhzF family phenazine biosynthesis protein [Microvirga sp. BSC39]KFG68769.1 isomerase [Microvirga sp. BSC39]
MRAPIFQVDAFTSRRFSGNPAAVIVLDRFPPEDVLQAVAAENNLPETAFVVADNGDYRIRWFTPTVEVPLCGHATLASAAVVMERVEHAREVVVFHSASGPLTVRRSATGYVMDFPRRTLEPVAMPPELPSALGATPVEVVWDGSNFLARLATAEIVRSLNPDLAAIERLARSGVIVTAPGDAGFDFVSRYFAPAKGIPEDPVTGGAHCGLTPFWAERLDQTAFRAFQASRRGGEIVCRLVGDRVELEGACVFYLEGTVDF